jgi:hypothetical protein
MRRHRAVQDREPRQGGDADQQVGGGSLQGPHRSCVATRVKQGGVEVAGHRKDDGQQLTV